MNEATDRTGFRKMIALETVVTTELVVVMIFYYIHNVYKIKNFIIF